MSAEWGWMAQLFSSPCHNLFEFLLSYLFILSVSQPPRFGPEVMDLHPAWNWMVWSLVWPMPVVGGDRALLWGQRRGEHWWLAWPATSSLGFLPMKENAAQQGVAGVLCGHWTGSQMRWWTRATGDQKTLQESYSEERDQETLQAWSSPPLLPAQPTPLGAGRSEEHKTRPAFTATALVLGCDQT